MIPWVSVLELELVHDDKVADLKSKSENYFHHLWVSVSSSNSRPASFSSCPLSRQAQVLQIDTFLVLFKSYVMWYWVCICVHAVHSAAWSSSCGDICCSHVITTYPLLSLTTRDKTHAHTDTLLKLFCRKNDSVYADHSSSSSSSCFCFSPPSVKGFFWDATL